MKFSEFDLDPQLLDGIEVLGFEEATPIQVQAIPEILAGKDVIACAQTGTGKTGAYLIPLIDELSRRKSELSRAIIIVPTRELAGQIDQNMEALSYYTGVSSVAIFGGKNAAGFDQQKFAVTNGADVLIATPGRLIIHMALGYMDLSQIEVVVLDEADKMLDMGFYDDIMRIISDLPTDRQTLMFSATMPPKIRSLAKKIMKDPIEISLNLSKPAEGINQMAFVCYNDQKIPLLEHLLKERDVDSMIIFASSKISVDEITRKLKSLNYAVKAMHSDKSQEERQNTLRQFKNKEFRILVGTDVLARGIDIDNLSHVVNYDVPMDAEDYVHRVGRTARADSTGEAITFVNPRDMRKLHSIEQLIEQPIPQPGVPEELGETPGYHPGRRSGGGGSRNRRSGGRHNGNRRNSSGSSDNKRSGNRRHRSRRRSGGQDSQDRNRDNRPQNQGSPEASDAKKRNKRRRRRSHKRRSPESGNPPA